MLKLEGLIHYENENNCDKTAMEFGSHFAQKTHSIPETWEVGDKWRGARIKEEGRLRQD